MKAWQQTNIITCRNAKWWLWWMLVQGSWLGTSVTVSIWKASQNWFMTRNLNAGFLRCITAGQEEIKCQTKWDSKSMFTVTLRLRLPPGPSRNFVKRCIRNWIPEEDGHFRGENRKQCLLRPDYILQGFQIQESYANRAGSTPHSPSSSPVSFKLSVSSSSRGAFYVFKSI